MNIATGLFSPISKQLVEERSELFKLQARKDQYQEIADRVSRDLLSSEETIQYLTPLFIEGRIDELETKDAQLLERRDRIIMGALDQQAVGEARRATTLSEDRARLLGELGKTLQAQQGTENRLGEIETLLTAVSNELRRLQRVAAAGPLIADLKVTHCPACDQPVSTNGSSSTECFLCSQPVNPDVANQRLAFEMAQLKQEKNEFSELTSNLEQERRDNTVIIERLQERIDIVERNLQPTRSKVGALISMDISSIDSERGRVEERIRQFRRFHKVLEHSEALSKEIDELQTRIAQHDAELRDIESGVSFESASDDIEEGMLDYFNLLNQHMAEHDIPQSFHWTQGRVSLDIRSRSFSFKIKDRKWSSQLGGTFHAFFLLAYHYALLNLTPKAHRNYPGLTILDFQAEYLDAKSIGDKENYLVEPFVDLCRRSETPMQVIVAGRSFQNLENVNRIELSHVWK